MTALADLLGSGIVRTVLAGAAVLGMVSGLLGAFAVLRRQSLLGDTLAHAALPGVCLGFLVAGGRDLAWITAGALVAGTAAALLVLTIQRMTPLKADAAQGIVLSSFFAVGVVLLTALQARAGAGALGLGDFLFGQAAAILPGDLWLMGGVAAVSLAVVLIFWAPFKLVSFDPDFARAQGLPVAAVEAGLTAMIALAIVIGLQMVGVVLMVALLIAPAAAARQWAGSLGGMVALSAGFGALAGAGGALVSATARGLATGPVVVLIATGLVLASLLVAPGRGLIWQARAARVARARISDDRLMGALQGLAAAHDDARYPSEKGMLTAALGAEPGARQLADLERRGLIRAVTHAPETTPHWALTRAGRDYAGRDYAGRGDAGPGDTRAGDMGAGGAGAGGAGAGDSVSGNTGAGNRGAVAPDRAGGTGR